MVVIAFAENNDLFDMFWRLRESWAVRDGIVKNQQLSGKCRHNRLLQLIDRL